MKDSVQALFSKLVSIDRTGVYDILRHTAADSGIDGMSEILTNALELIGEGWEAGELSLAQVYMSGVICEELLNSILPESDRSDNTLPVLGAAVFLDHHSLGMKIVSSLVKSRRYPLFNLGIGVDVDEIITGIHKYKVDILMISVLMYPSALEIKKLSERMILECPKVPIVVGGAPFRLDRDLYKKVGAHRSAGNAGEMFGILEDIKKNIISQETLL